MTYRNTIGRWTECLGRLMRVTMAEPTSMGAAGIAIAFLDDQIIYS